MIDAKNLVVITMDCYGMAVVPPQNGDKFLTCYAVDTTTVQGMMQVLVPFIRFKSKDEIEEFQSLGKLLVIRQLPEQERVEFHLAAEEANYYMCRELHNQLHPTESYQEYIPPKSENISKEQVYEILFDRGELVEWPKAK